MTGARDPGLTYRRSVFPSQLFLFGFGHIVEDKLGGIRSLTNVLHCE